MSETMRRLSELYAQNTKDDIPKISYAKFLIKKAIDENPYPYKYFSIERNFIYKEDIYAMISQSLRSCEVGENFFRDLNPNLTISDIKNILADLNIYYYIVSEEVRSFRFMIVPEETYKKYKDYWDFRSSDEFQLYKELSR